MTLTIKARPSATNALQQRVTALDRSTEKASAQISEAFSLLAINLDNTTTRFSPESSEEERRRGFGPKEEWVLRWLLKRIDGDTVQAESFRIEPTAWILLKILVARLSTAVVARHLSAFKFIVAFERTLGRLSVLAHGIQLPMDSVNSGPPVQALVSRENSSSSTVQESPFVVNQNSKKRKRDTESSVNNAVSMSAKHLRRLYLSICGAVSQVEEHTVSASGGADEFAAEHMKAAMKTSVEQSAKILGNALQVLKYILMIPGDDTRTWETCDYDYVLKPLINIWNLRSSLEDAHNGPLSARAFSESCLLPALVLVMKLGSSPDEVADKTSLSQRILPLLAAHIILPGRAGFMAVKDQKLDANSTSLVSELLAPIAKSLHELSSVDANIGLLKNAIPVLFEFAVHLMPRNTPKQRLIEGLWLRALFVQLAGCLFTQFPIPINVSEDDLNTYILERMLQIVVHNKLSLEVSILQNIILNISGVHRARPQHRAWWGLVGLSIKINPDVALPIRTNSNSRATGTTKPSNVVLEKILTKLTSSGFKFGSRYSDDYENMLHHVILPILESFIRARDLEGFIDVLKQRLSIWDSRGELENNSQQCPDNAVSIWEDEALLHSISSNLESALTAGQISRMLQHITVTIDGLSIPLSREEQSKLYAELVIIDTVISGISDDQTLSKCKEPVRSINHTLSAFLMNDAILPDGHRWLVWRALATITAHFPYCTEDCVRKAQEQQILGLTRQPQFTIRPAQWQETLFALRYIIGSCQGQGHSGPIGITSVVMTSVVNAIANAMAATFSENHISTESQAASRGYYAWDGKVETVTNTETLLVACAAQLILVTQCLVVIEPAVLAEFTEQLYQQAAMHAHWSQSLRICSSETNFIGFGTLWESFILTGTTGEYPSIAKVIRKTVLKSFLDAEELNGPRDDSQCSQFAVIAIHQLSLGSFEYDERKEILDRTCIKVLQNPDLRHGDQYLALLEHSLDHPKKSMRIFSESSFLWQLADVLDSSKTSLSQDGVLITFRQLVAKTISFIIEHDKNDQYTSFSDSFLDILATRVAALDAASIAPANTIMVLVCLVTVWNRSPTMPARMSRGTLSITEISREILQWLPNILATYQGELDSWQINVVHDSLETYLSMIGAGLDQSASVAGRLRSEIIRNCQSIKDLASNGIWDAKSDSVNTYTIEDLLVTVKKVETSLASDGSAISALGIHALEDFKTTRAKRAWLQYLTNSFWKLDTHLQADNMIRLTHLEHGEEIRLLYLRSVLSQTYDQQSDIKPALSQTYPALCRELCKSSSSRCYVLEMQCLDLMMTKNAWSISQWHIDTLLSTITNVTSKSGRPQLERFPNVFTCLCRLSSTILTLHRSKLGGRYHLVVMALQCMLRCFFIPYAVSACIGHSPERSLELSNSRLDQTHASAYARLLTSICDPSVSAVTRSKNRQRPELNDETKKARSIAGQHLQYLIMELCQCQLRGRVEPEVRAALNPGIYAIFDAMSQEVMRTVNSALDSGSRAIFKVLYDDYRRFGRWQGA